MHTNFNVIGLTRLGIIPKSTAPDADVLTIRPSEPSDSFNHYPFMMWLYSSRYSHKHACVSRNKEKKQEERFSYHLVDLNESLPSMLLSLDLTAISNPDGSDQTLPTALL